MKKVLLLVLATLLSAPAAVFGTEVNSDPIPITLPLSGVTDPGLNPAIAKGGVISGVSEQAGSVHALQVGRNADNMVLKRDTTTPQMLLFELDTLNVLTGVTPTDIGTGSSLYGYGYPSGSTWYRTPHPDCTAISGVTWQIYYKEGLEADSDWSGKRQKQLTPEGTYSGDTPFMINAGIVTAPYIKFYFAGGTTAWGTVSGRVWCVDMPAVLPTGLIDTWEVGVGTFSGGSRFGVAADQTFQPSGTTAYPLQEAATVIGIQPNGAEMYYTTNGDEATADDLYLEDGKEYYFTRKEYEDLNGFFDIAANYTVRQFNFGPAGL